MIKLNKLDWIVSTLSIGLLSTKHRLWNKDCAEKCFSPVLFFFFFLIYFYAMCFNAQCLSNSHVPIARARHDEINIRQSLTSTHKAAWRSSGNPRLICGAALKYSLQKWKFEASKKKINLPVPHPWEEAFGCFDWKTNLLCRVTSEF